MITVKELENLLQKPCFSNLLFQLFDSTKSGFLVQQDWIDTLKSSTRVNNHFQSELFHISWILYSDRCMLYHILQITFLSWILYHFMMYPLSYPGYKFCILDPVSYILYTINCSVLYPIKCSILYPVSCIQYPEYSSNSINCLTVQLLTSRNDFVELVEAVTYLISGDSPVDPDSFHKVGLSHRVEVIRALNSSHVNQNIM